MAKVDIRSALIEQDEAKATQEDINNLHWYGSDDPVIVARRKAEEDKDYEYFMKSLIDDLYTDDYDYGEDYQDKRIENLELSHPYYEYYYDEWDD